MLFALILYALTIIISLFFFREDVKNAGDCYSLEDLFRSFLLLFVPIVNLIYHIIVWYENIEYEIDVEELLKKIFFISNDKNKKR